MQLKRIIEKDDTINGKIFDLIIQFLIIVSLISFTIETIPDLSETTTKFLRVLDIIIVSIFSLEYLCRIYIADKKSKLVLAFMA